ncbi:MAG: ketopantoate reductase family protein [Deferrisomatales bacterium]|nr:ketopantoate reductase family protein [Deferrisomatales bacterium]
MRQGGHPSGPLRIAIVGAGVIGSIFGHLYRRAGHRVLLVDKDPRRVDRLASDGVMLELPDGDEARVGGPAVGYPLPEGLGPFDLVQVSVKGYDTRGAARDLVPLLGPETAVLSVQNGLGNLETLAETAGGDRVLGGVTAHSGQALGEDRVRWAGGAGPLVAAGPLDPRTTFPFRPLLEELRSSLAHLGFEVHVLDDVAPALWRKLIANVSTNPVAAVTGRTGARILASPPLCDLVDLLAEEAAAVARARRLAFPELDRPGEFCRWALAGVRDNKISMLQDVEARRRTEIDSLNEALCREGQRLGVPTPAHRVMSCLVRALEEGFSTQGPGER